MAQGGSKPSYFVPKRVERALNKNEIKLATQPCPSDKWGKQMNEKLQKENDYPSLTVLGVGWAKLTLRCRHKLNKQIVENYK
jgi:hypothetical protein